jgi:hypothetical protein
MSMELTPSQWIAKCAERLGQRWRTVPVSELEAAAVEVWHDAALRELAPEEAAARWLAPVEELPSRTEYDAEMASISLTTGGPELPRAA